LARVWSGLHRHPIWTGVGVFVGLLIVFALVWNWNWFRPMVAKKIADELQRPVMLQHFDVENALSAQPTLVLDGIAIGNPPDFPDGTQTGTVDELRVSFDLRALIGSWGKKIIVSELIVQHPEGDLRPGPKGNPNWTFPIAEDSSGNAAPPRIGSLVITDGNFRFADPRLKADLQVKVQTQPADQKHEQQIVIDAQGTYGGQPLKGHFVGGSVLALRNSTKPYPVELTVSSGDTHMHLAGTIDHPEQLSGANLQLELQGQDLADLYKLLRLPLQPSPPYSLRGHLDYDNGGKTIRFTKLVGRVGESDLEGDFNVNRAGARPEVTADLTSRNVRMADLGGFIGAPPGRKDSPTEGPKQRAEHAAQEAKPTLLPDTPIDLGKIRSTDFKVHYRGEHIVTDWAPLDHLEAKLTIKDGDIRLEPLDFAVGNGTIHSTIDLDGRVNPIRAKADIDFRHIDLQRVVQNIKFAQGAGVIGGRWIIDGTGNSLAQILAHSNGDVKLFMGSGDLSAIIVNAAGLDVGGTLASLLGLPQTAKINCMVSDFALKNGVLDTRALVLDTDQGNVYGRGNIDLRSEGIAFQISEEGKHVSVGALHAPIDINGSFKDFSVKPEPAALVSRIGIAAALGAVFPPAGLLATIQFGLGKDHNCGALIAAAQQQQPISPATAGPTTGTPNGPAVLPSGVAEPNPGPAADSAKPQQAQAPVPTPEPKPAPPSKAAPAR
jgi:AsmA family protein